MRKKILEKWNKFQNHSEFQRAFVNTGWLFFDKMIQIVISFFVGIMVVRYLGPEKYGILSYCLAVMFFFSVLSKLGLNPIVIRNFVNSSISSEKIFGTAFYLKLWGGILAAFCTVVVAFLFKHDVLITFISAILAFGFVFQATDVIDYWFQAQVTSKYAVYARMFACIVSALIKIYLIFIQADLVWFAAAISIEALFVAIGLIFTYFKYNHSVKKWIFDKQTSRVLIRDSWPLMIVLFSSTVYLRIDQVMIGNMLSYEELGNYSAAVALSEMWYFMPTAITASLFPAIILAKDQDVSLYHNYLQKLYNLMVFLAVLIAIGITFLGDWLVSFIYGYEYLKASDVLVVYIWANIFVFLSTVSNKWFIAENLQKFLSLYALCGAFINMMLNYILIPHIGIVGAAWATFISYFLYMYLFSAIFSVTRKNFIRMSRSLFFYEYSKKIISLIDFRKNNEKTK